MLCSQKLIRCAGAVDFSAVLVQLPRSDQIKPKPSQIKAKPAKIKSVTAQISKYQANSDRHQQLADLDEQTKIAGHFHMIPDRK